MRRMLLGMILCCAAMPALAADEDIVLRGMGSFHVGGRVAEVSGKAVRMIVRQPGGPQTKLDPNGQYMVEQMYVQYFLPKQQQGQAAAADVAWRRADRRHLREHARRPRRLAQLVHPQGLGRLRVRRGRARPLRASRRPTSGRREPTFLTYQPIRSSAFASATAKARGIADPAKRKVLPGSQFPVEAYDNYMKQTVPRWLSTDDAIIAAYIALVDKVCPCVLLLHSQGGAFGFKVAGAAARQGQGDRRGRVGDRGHHRQGRRKLKDTPVLMLFGDYVDQHPRWATSRRSTSSMATRSRRPAAPSTGSTFRTSASRATRTC